MRKKPKQPLPAAPKWSMELGLLENAANSVLHGIEHYARGRFDPIHFKFAVQHLAHGIELLLKERLAREHPLLIWEDVARPAGRAVSWEVAIKRLTAAGIDVSSFIPAITSLRNLRNRIEHFQFTLTEKEASAAIGGILDFLFRFPVEELSINLQLAFPDPKKWNKLLKLGEIRTRAKDTAESMLAQAGPQYLRLNHPCLVCAEAYVVAAPDATSGDDATCLLCGHKYEVVQCESCETFHPAALTVEFPEEEGPPVYLCQDCARRIEAEAERYEGWGGV